jgi:hypothetical protein
VQISKIKEGRSSFEDGLRSSGNDRPRKNGVDVYSRKPFQPKVLIKSKPADPAQTKILIEHLGGFLYKEIAEFVKIRFDPSIAPIEPRLREVANG